MSAKMNPSIFLMNLSVTPRTMTCSVDATAKKNVSRKCSARDFYLTEEMNEKIEDFSKVSPYFRTYPKEGSQEKEADLAEFVNKNKGERKWRRKRKKEQLCDSENARILHPEGFRTGKSLYIGFITNSDISIFKGIHFLSHVFI